MARRRRLTGSHEDREDSLRSLERRVKDGAERCEHWAARGDCVNMESELRELERFLGEARVRSEALPETRRSGLDRIERSVGASRLNFKRRCMLVPR